MFQLIYTLISVLDSTSVLCHFSSSKIQFSMFKSIMNVTLKGVGVGRKGGGVEEPGECTGH